METIETLKQAAREREERREAEVEAREAARLHEIAQRNSSLYETLRTCLPFSNLTAAGNPVVVEDSRDLSEVVVNFDIPGHAPLEARFVWNPPSADWKHAGFTAERFQVGGYRHFEDDPEKMWRVKEFEKLAYNNGGGEDDGTYYPWFNDREFRDLGDALLFAERAYRDPADIQREIDEKNARVAADLLVPGGYAGTVSLTPPAPEPTNAEILVDALKNFVQEQLLIARDFA